MTHLDLARVEERETKKMKAPAKAWRNKWRNLRDWSAGDTGRIHPAGKVAWGARTYPSKELAEQDADNWLNMNGLWWAEYLGAFPVTP